MDTLLDDFIQDAVHLFSCNVTVTFHFRYQNVTCNVCLQNIVASSVLEQLFRDDRHVFVTKVCDVL
ncbi:MAG: hypothetical protein WA099_03590 [Sulfuricurvum sp.]